MCRTGMRSSTERKKRVSKSRIQCQKDKRQKARPIVVRDEVAVVRDEVDNEKNTNKVQLKQSRKRQRRESEEKSPTVSLMDTKRGSSEKENGIMAHAPVLKEKTAKQSEPSSSKNPPRIKGASKSTVPPPERPSGSTTMLSCCMLDKNISYGTSNRHCKEKDTCRIRKGEEYMCSKAKPEAENICLDCFDTADVYKDKWTKKVNINNKREETIDCSECGDSWHKLCALHFEESFVCPNCCGGERDWILETDPNCEIDVFLAEKANKLVNEGNVSVASFTTKKSVTTRTLMPDFYQKDAKKKYGSTVDYVARAIYFFQIVDNISVAFFTMFAQEYHNLAGKSWCVIDYLDSVPWMTSTSKKPSRVYSQLILAYFEHMGKKGFKHGHLWANPPCPGDDYAFNVHPEFQKYLDRNALICWYQSLLEEGRKAGLISNFRNFREESADGKFNKPIDLPVFVKSLWQEVLLATQDKMLVNKEVAYNKINFEKSLEEDYKERAEDNFYIDLCGSQRLKPLPTQNLNSHEILGDRETFLDKCIAENWEFSSLRRAKYSSVGIIGLIKAARGQQ
ncbi:hypothetical protein CRE_21375 [Caenorhabditis remanei]|uniref:histone acetyltransferase n=1 Tax=Caenorhabditis remanei TaxID=31234 RepID=E3MUM2_CAERE|nr:hypothetical protein CRE_21375 [Caenorhabditis remanei]